MSETYGKLPQHEIEKTCNLQLILFDKQIVLNSVDA